MKSNITITLIHESTHAIFYFDINNSKEQSNCEVKAKASRSSRGWPASIVAWESRTFISF